VLSFLLASWVLVAIPGPDQALITRNALVHGRRAAFSTMLGGASGLGVHAVAAAFGLSALINASATAYTMLKVLGVSYLLYLGVTTLVSARPEGQFHVPSATRAGAWRFARQGATSNALNPKVAVFFLTFLPQFLPSHAPPLMALALAGGFAAVYLSWFTLYIVLLDHFGRQLRRQRVQLWLQRTTGGLLLTFGVRLAFDRR